MRRLDVFIFASSLMLSGCGLTTITFTPPLKAWTPVRGQCVAIVAGQNSRNNREATRVATVVVAQQLQKRGFSMCDGKNADLIATVHGEFSGSSYRSTDVVAVPVISSGVVTTPSGSTPYFESGVGMAAAPSMHTALYFTISVSIAKVSADWNAWEGIVSNLRSNYDAKSEAPGMAAQLFRCFPEMDCLHKRTSSDGSVVYSSESD